MGAFFNESFGNSIQLNRPPDSAILFGAAVSGRVSVSGFLSAQLKLVGTLTVSNFSARGDVWAGTSSTLHGSLKVSCKARGVMYAPLPHITPGYRSYRRRRRYGSE